MSSLSGDHKKRVDYIISSLEQMAAGNLTNRLEISDRRDELDAICLGINILADEVLYKQKQLVQSDKMAALGRISAGMAHEINNPLMIIRGYAENLESLFNTGSIDAVKLQSHIKKINSGVDRIVKIMTHIKDFSRQSSQNFSPVEIQKVIEDSLVLLERPLSLSAIKVDKKLPQEKLFVLGDTTRLEQVFLNILSNAKDAIDDLDGDNGRIEIQVNRRDRFIQIEISDNGMGLDDSLHEQVFEPFFTTKGVGKGTGLGLSISHGIVKDHNGSIRFLSTKGAGSLVQLTLPVLEC
jgi:C4-dicarboxylate-specific signal transduction histidine kinase